MNTKQPLIKQIDENIEKIRNLRPLSKIEIIELRKALGVMFTYSSNAIEGNTLTLGETKLILEDGLTIGGKTLREINETSNHKGILEFLYSFLDGNIKFNENLIKKVHYLVLKNIDDENAGKYRKIQCYISGDEQIPPKAIEIKKLMSELIIWYNKNIDKIHPAIFVSEFHHKFVKIHPFIDGNGRTIRILINIILMKKGYPMIIIPPIRRSEYISSLNSTNNIDDFIVFMLDIINVNIQDYSIMINDN